MAHLDAEEQVGRYLVLEKVGQGGMGIVYAAWDPDLGRRVAIKLLRMDKRLPEGRSVGQARLLREAQAMARVSHPQVISVFDVGTLGDGVFIAMEFVDGTTLKKWVKEKPRSWREVLDTFLAAGWRAPTLRASSTATSSRRTCRSARTGAFASPTLAWPAWPTRTPRAPCPPCLRVPP
jgi:serine/threonine protein kinase